MTPRDLLIFALIGFAAGWIATRLLEGRGRGLLMNVLLGLVGAYVGPFILEFFDVTVSGLLGLLVAAIVGAIALLFVAHAVGSLTIVLIVAVVVLVVLAGGIQIR
jgi:uncharacterized membrane protein YeaQ/YmgE (transglycosylase-associated protein family)